MNNSLYAPWTEYYEPVDPRLFQQFNPPVAPVAPEVPEKMGRMDRISDWLAGNRTPRSEWPGWGRREPIDWQTALLQSQGFTPSSASDFPDSGLGLVDNRNWSWKNFLNLLAAGEMARAEGIGGMGITGDRSEQSQAGLDASLDMMRHNRERNEMRRADVGDARYALDLATPPASILFGTAFPTGTMARGMGRVASGLGKVFPNTFRHTGPRFVEAYFPQATGVMRGLQAAGERLPFIMGMNEVSASEPGRGFRTAIPWAVGGVGYGAGTLIGRSILRRNALSGISRAGISGQRQAENLYDASMNRILPNLFFGGGGGAGGHVLGSGLIVNTMDRRDILRENQNQPPAPVMVEDPNLYQPYTPSITRGW